MDLAIIATIAAVAGAASGWVPVAMARRRDRDALTSAIAELHGRLTRIETRLDERGHAEHLSRELAAMKAASGFREFCEEHCPRQNP